MVRIAIFLTLLNLCSWAEELTHVGFQELTYTDDSRHRTIPYLALYPCELTLHTKAPYGCFLAENAELEDPAKKYPLVMYSHHHRGCYWDSLWLGYFLVQYGYVFVSVDHPGNTYYTQDVESNYFSYWHRPLDISAALTHVTQDQFKDSIDLTNITMAGFSMGGLTSLWLSGAVADPDLFRQILLKRLPKDLPPSIKDQITKLPSDSLGQFYKETLFTRFIALAPGFGQAFTPIGLQLIDKRVLCITSASDQITPAEFNADHYSEYVSTVQSITLTSQAGHYVFVNEGSANQRRKSPEIYADTEEFDRQEIHWATQNLILKFLQGQPLWHDEHTP